MKPNRWHWKQIAIISVLIALLLGSNLVAYHLGSSRPVGEAPSEGAYPEKGVPPDGDHFSEAMEQFVQVLEKISRDYLEPVTLDRLLEGAIEGTLKVLDDPQTCYYDSSRLEDFMIETTGLFSGVGVRLAEIGDQTWVLALFPGSPAERAGLNAGDRLISVDGTAISGESLQRAADLIRGPPGTPVKVAVERPGVTGPLEITIQREEVKVETVFSRVKEPGIGYIQITGFERSTGASFIRQLEALEETDGLGKGLILDLRNNAGGLLEEALQIAGELVPEGEITRLVDRRGEVLDIHHSYSSGKPYPLVVLINEESASASEVIAGALQDHRAALLVGETTYGKATVQNLEDLAGGGALKLTVAKYLTPSGYDLHGQGLKPDYPLKLPEAFKHYDTFFPGVLERGDWGLEVELLQQMLKELNIKPVTPSGYFDSNTAEALADFQRDCGLEADGILDSLTALRLRQAMEQLLAENDPQLELARNLLVNPAHSFSKGGEAAAWNLYRN